MRCYKTFKSLKKKKLFSLSFLQADMAINDGQEAVTYDFMSAVSVVGEVILLRTPRKTVIQKKCDL